MSESLISFCAEGCRFAETYIPTSERVSLRVITFEPPKASNNPAVVFVAGWISRIEGWQEVLIEMTRNFIVYYIETREKVSSKIRGRVAFSVEALGDDVVEIVRCLGLKENEYILFGSSLGATVILDFFRKLNVAPKCLILVGPNAAFFVPIIWKIIVFLFYPRFYLLLKPFIKWYLRTFRMRVDQDYAQYEKYCRALDAADPFKLKKAAMAFWKYQVWGILETVRVPVLILGGSHDKLHEPENLKRMTDMLANACYVDMKTNHETHTARAVEAMQEFLESKQTFAY